MYLSFSLNFSSAPYIYLAITIHSFPLESILCLRQASSQLPMNPHFRPNCTHRALCFLHLIAACTSAASIAHLSRDVPKWTCFRPAPAAGQKQSPDTAPQSNAKVV
ncbi:unnamed protein product [Protopolystoma xenopodis]|uniref:Uncharacterized protein n=1 Tax=Protopolystoma xenopodis TaxID=117903 RepID=A0A3S5B5L0_9PLAT|nr:unnamed protein product [Protopolystoma xenopodis]